jgi:hypothetical protein
MASGFPLSSLLLDLDGVDELDINLAAPRSRAKRTQKEPALVKPSALFQTRDLAHGPGL